MQYQLLNVEQACKRLACSKRHVYDLIEEGALQHIRIGKKRGLRILESSLVEFIRSKLGASRA